MTRCGSRAGSARCGTGFSRFRLDGGEFAREAVRTERIQQLELGPARRVRATVGEVDDLALLGFRRWPCAAPRRSSADPRTASDSGAPCGSLVHALLHDDPLPVVGDDEAVQIEVEAILHGGAVDLGHQPAGVGERRAVEADPLADRGELVRRLARMLAAPAADVDAEFARQRLKAALQRADDAGGDARGMPVHAHHGAERLEPERMRQAAQQLVAAVLMDDRLADHRAQPRHAVREPRRHPPAMQRQIGASCSTGHAWSISFSLLPALPAPIHSRFGLHGRRRRRTTVSSDADLPMTKPGFSCSIGPRKFFAD